MLEPSSVVVTDDDDPDAPWFFASTTPFLDRMKEELPLEELSSGEAVMAAIATRLRWLREHPEGSVLSRWGLLEAGYFNETSELVQRGLARWWPSGKAAPAVALGE